MRANVALGAGEPAAAQLDELRRISATVGTDPLRAAVRVCEGLLAAAAYEHDSARSRSCVSSRRD